jgi:hypothetical protein
MLLKKNRAGACRPGISGPTRPGSDEKYDIHYLRQNKHRYFAELFIKN